MASNMDLNVRINAIDNASRTLRRIKQEMLRMDGAFPRHQRAGAAPGHAAGAGMREMGRQGQAVAAARAERGRALAATGGMGAMGAMGVPMPALGALGGGYAATSIVSEAADFEASLVGIQKKSGATSQEMAAIGNEIRTMATSGEVGVSMEEIASAYERGAAGGLPLDELKEFARLSAMASDAFEMSAEDVGNASAGFHKVLGVPMSAMEGYFDLINGLADSGIADEVDIVRYIDQAGAMSKTFGLAKEETAAFGATLANLKVPAAKGATAMNSILTRLLAPSALSSDGREAYYSLIKDDKKFKRQLESGDADKAFLDVIDALKAMDKETRTGIIVELFGQDHLDVMTQLVEGSDELKKNLGYAAGNDWAGSLGKSYDLKLGTFWSQFEVLKNRLSDLKITIGLMGLDNAKGGLETLGRLIAETKRGLETFEVLVDWTELEAAKDAIGNLRTSLSELMGMGGEDTALTTFFARLATSVNAISSGIGVVKDAAQMLGLAEPDGDTPEQQAARRAKFGEAIGEISPPTKILQGDFSPITENPAIGAIQGAGDAFMDWLDGTGRFAPPATEGRVVPPTPGSTPVDPGRFDMGKNPVMGQAELDVFLDRLRTEARAAQTNFVPPLPQDIPQLPSQVGLPAIDGGAYLEEVARMKAAREGIETAIQVTGTADINTGPAHAKLAALRSDAASTAQAVSASLSASGGGGDASRFKARVRDQF